MSIGPAMPSLKCQINQKRKKKNDRNMEMFKHFAVTGSTDKPD